MPEMACTQQTPLRYAHVAYKTMRNVVASGSCCLRLL
jgi:hypothetical protein